MVQGFARPTRPDSTDHAYSAFGEARQASPLDWLLIRNTVLSFAASFFINVVFKLIDRHRLFLNYVLE